MKHLNIEIKAKCENLDAARETLKHRGAIFKGCDRQTDTYFKVPKGRLKLREGNIENCFVYYERENTAGPKSAEVILYPLTAPAGQLKEILAQTHGVLTVVEKTREIYFLENVKFHLDTVPGLGTFVEIEAIDQNGSVGKARLDEQCRFYMNLLHVKNEGLVTVSYSDMLLCQSKEKCICP